jgi:hypothetical protein
MIMLNELHVKTGSARQQQYAGTGGMNVMSKKAVLDSNNMLGQAE